MEYIDKFFETFEDQFTAEEKAIWKDIEARNRSTWNYEEETIMHYLRFKLFSGNNFNGQLSEAQMDQFRRLEYEYNLYSSFLNVQNTLNSNGYKIPLIIKLALIVAAILGLYNLYKLFVPENTDDRNPEINKNADLNRYRGGAFLQKVEEKSNHFLTLLNNIIQHSNPSQYSEIWNDLDVLVSIEIEKMILEFIEIGPVLKPVKRERGCSLETATVTNISKGKRFRKQISAGRAKLIRVPKQLISVTKQAVSFTWNRGRNMSYKVFNERVATQTLGILHFASTKTVSHFFANKIITDLSTKAYKRILFAALSFGFAINFPQSKPSESLITRQWQDDMRINQNQPKLQMLQLSQDKIQPSQDKIHLSEDEIHLSQDEIYLAQLEIQKLFETVAEIERNRAVFASASVAPLIENDIQIASPEIRRFTPGTSPKQQMPVSEVTLEVAKTDETGGISQTNSVKITRTKATSTSKTTSKSARTVVKKPRVRYIRDVEEPYKEQDDGEEDYVQEKPRQLPIRERIRDQLYNPDQNNSN